MPLRFNYNASSQTYTIATGSTCIGALEVPDAIGEYQLPIVGIENDAFKGSTTLTSVKIGSNITSIGASAFADCTNLVSVDASLSNVTYMGEKTFINCINLVTASFPAFATSPSPPPSVTWAGQNLRGCPKLTTVNISNGIKVINFATFAFCTLLNNVTIPETVTQIMGSIFTQCYGLSSINIPSSVTAIGNNAFERCGNLLSVNFLPDSNLTTVGEYAFLLCAKLTSINFNSAMPLTTLGSFAFWLCSKLESIILPDTLQVINSYTFADNFQLKNVTFPSGLKVIGNEAFGNSGILAASIPNGVTSMGQAVFQGCAGLITANIPTSITSLGGTVFRFCSNLTSNIVFPEGLQEIPGGFLYGCAKVTSITLPSTIKHIRGNDTFNGTAITSMVLPEGLLSISDWVFSNCSKLVTINLPNSLTTIGYGTFANCAKLEGITLPPNLNGLRFAFFGCSSLTSVNIPGTCTRIEPSSFSGCTNLATVIINNGVQRIESYAFNGCAKLTSLNLPNSISEIGINAFYNSGIVTINIPPLINKIDISVFSNCKDLKAITIPSNITSIMESAFKGSGLENIIIPASVNYLGDSVFSQCLSLNSLSIQNNNITVGKNIFAGATLANLILGDFNYSFTANKVTIKAYTGTDEIINIPSSIFDTVIYKIGDSAFEDNINLKEINFTSPIDAILDNAFKNCINLSKITLLKSIASIGNSAFYGCSSLSGELKLPKDLLSIGNYAFYACNNITSLILENKISTIGDYAFANCSILNLIYFYGNAPTFGSNVFNNISSGKIFLRYSAKSGWDNVSAQISPLSLIVYSLVKSSRITSTSGNKKSFIVKTQDLSTINVFKNKTYLFKSASNNLLSQIFNPALFSDGNIIAISDISSPNNLFIKFKKSSNNVWLDFNSEVNSNNYSIPNNSVLSFITFVPSIAIGGGALIQKYPSGGAKISAAYPIDQDALNYVLAVENIDGERLEQKVKIAIENFVVGCKNDGIWDSIKESCLIGGARTLSAALLPLKGNAPTNTNFVSSDYNRKIGITARYGDLKSLKAGSKNLDYPRDNVHAAVYVTQPLDIFYKYYFFSVKPDVAVGFFSRNTINLSVSTDIFSFSLRKCTFSSTPTYWNSDYSAKTFSGLVGTSKPNDLSVEGRINGNSYTQILVPCSSPYWVSRAYPQGDIHLFTNSPTSSDYYYYSPGTIGFYSLGENIDLVKLETRLKIYFDEINIGIEDE